MCSNAIRVSGLAMVSGSAAAEAAVTGALRGLCQPGGAADSRTSATTGKARLNTASSDQQLAVDSGACATAFAKSSNFEIRHQGCGSGLFHGPAGQRATARLPDDQVGRDDHRTKFVGRVRSDPIQQQLGGPLSLFIA